VVVGAGAAQAAVAIAAMPHRTAAAALVQPRVG